MLAVLMNHLALDRSDCRLERTVSNQPLNMQQASNSGAKNGNKGQEI
jgi:hypothetical protein